MFLFLHFVEATLKAGQDPYKILGVPRSSSQSEIRRAFTAIARKHHPDVSKDPQSQKIWIEANDAYDILSDANRKRIYDHTGNVAEDPEIHQRPRQDSPFQYFYRGYDQVEFKTPEVNYDQLMKLSKEGKDSFVFMYNAPPIFFASYVNTFERVVEELSDFGNFFHSTPNLMYHNGKSLGINRYPVIIHVHPYSDGELRITSTTSSLDNEKEVSKWIKKQLGNNPREFHKLKAVKKWIRKDPDQIHVLFVERRSLSLDALHYSITKSDYIHFGVITTDLVNVIREWKIKELPAIILFENGKVHELKTLSKIHDFIQIPRINRRLFRSKCGKVCGLYIGKPSPELQAKSKTFTFPIFYDLSNGHMARKLHLRPDSFVLLSTDKYSNTTLSSFVKDAESFKANKIKKGNLPSDFEPPLQLSERIQGVVNDSWEKIKGFPYEYLIGIATQLLMLLPVLLLCCRKR